MPLDSLNRVTDMFEVAAAAARPLRSLEGRGLQEAIPPLSMSSDSRTRQVPRESGMLIVREFHFQSILTE